MQLLVLTQYVCTSWVQKSKGYDRNWSHKKEKNIRSWGTIFKNILILVSKYKTLIYLTCDAADKCIHIHIQQNTRREVTCTIVHCTYHIANCKGEKSLGKISVSRSSSDRGLSIVYIAQLHISHLTLHNAQCAHQGLPCWLCALHKIEMQPSRFDLNDKKVMRVVYIARFIKLNEIVRKDLHKTTN